MADDPRVSDHALIRYLERVMGIDLDPQRAEIVAITATGRATGATCVVSGKMLFTLSSCGRVITVQPHAGKKPPLHTGGRKRHKEIDQ